MKKLSLLLIISLVLAAGCDNMNHAEQNVLSGAALGTIGGAAIGALSGRAGEGAILGAGIGAVGGAMQDSARYQRGEYGYGPEVRYYRESPPQEYYIEEEYYCPPGYRCE